MKLKLILIAFILCTTATIAQTEDEAKPAHQIGVNASLFIKQFLSFNETSTTLSPYMLTYKYIEDNQGWRIGAGAFNTNTKTNTNSLSGLTSNTTLTIDTRLGYEWQKGLDKRWLVYYGVDGTYSYSKTRSTNTVQTGAFPPKTEEMISSSESFTIGGGPVLGMEFKINKRISLNTETTAYFSYNETRRREVNTFFIGFERNDYTAFSRVLVSLPTSIFFIITI
jgi:hypothetical protein